MLDLIENDPKLSNDKDKQDFLQSSLVTILESATNDIEYLLHQRSNRKCDYIQTLYNNLFNQRASAFTEKLSNNGNVLLKYSESQLEQSENSTTLPIAKNVFALTDKSNTIYVIQQELEENNLLNNCEGSKMFNSDKKSKDSNESNREALIQVIKGFDFVKVKFLVEKKSIDVDSGLLQRSTTVFGNLSLNQNKMEPDLFDKRYKDAAYIVTFLRKKFEQNGKKEQKDIEDVAMVSSISDDEKSTIQSDSYYAAQGGYNSEFSSEDIVDAQASITNGFDGTINSGNLETTATSRKVSSSHEPKKDDSIILLGEKNMFPSLDGERHALSSSSKENIPQVSNTKKSSKLPTIALVVASVALVAISVYVKILMVGVVIGACCLVAAAIVYYTSRPTNLVENSHTELLLNGGINR